MNKKLRYSLLTLLMAVFCGAWAQEVEYDLTSGWTMNSTAKTMTNGTVTFNAYGSASFKQNGGYVILGKSGAYIELPAYDFDVEKIEVVGHSGASGYVKQNIFVDDVAVSTETTGANGVTNTYVIAEDYQAAGTVYTLKVTSNHNTQIEAIKVYKKGATDPNAPGSENNPYTVAQAVQAIVNSGNVTGVYVTGIVSKVDQVNLTSGTATYWLSADGTTEGQQFEVYKGQYLNGADFTSESQIQVGDEVLVKGNITYYERGEVYEFSAGSQIVSLKRVPPIAVLNSITPTELLLADDSGEFTLDATFAEGTVADTDYIVVWQSDNTSVIDVFNYDSSKAYYELKGVGTANITITVMPNDETLYTEVSKTFEVTVVDHFKTDIATINGFDPTEVNIGDTGYMVADYSDIASPDDNFTLSWSSSDENVFYVDPETYDYEARAEGTAEVTLTITPEDTDLYNPVSFTQMVTVIDNTKNMLRTYQLVTNTDDITDGKYLIVYEGTKDDTEVSVALNGGLETLDAVGNTIAVTVADDLIVTDQDAYFTINTTDGTLQSASGKYIGMTESKNGLKQSDNAYTGHTFEIDGNRNAVIGLTFGNSTVTMRYNYASDQQRFRYYKSGQQPIKLYKEIPTPKTVEVTIGEAGAASFSSIYPLDFTDSDVYAYIITGRDGTNFTKERVYQVPANTGVVVAAFTANTYQVPVAATDAAIENNLLEATSTGEFTVTADDYGTVYGLFKSAKTGKVGFQKKKEGYTFGANKSYLRMPAGTSANEIFFDFDVTNAISNVAVETEAANSTDTYNLNGQKVNSSFRGVVIRGGKKLIQK